MFIASRNPLLPRFPLVSFELAGPLGCWWWACEWRGTNSKATVGWCVLCCGGTYTGILDGTIRGTEWNWGIVGMPNWGAGLERLMGGAGRAWTTGGIEKALAIVGIVSCNWEYTCISWRIAEFYWFKALFWNRSCRDTGNVDLGGTLDAWAWTVAVWRAGERMNDEL